MLIAGLGLMSGVADWFGISRIQAIQKYDTLLAMHVEPARWRSPTQKPGRRRSDWMSIARWQPPMRMRPGKRRFRFPTNMR